MRFFINGPHRGQPDRTGNVLARGLGAFSLLLGALELLKAGPLADSLGLDGLSWLIIAYGAREILTGVIVLLLKDAGPGIWLRVLGDVLDAGTLAFGFVRDPADHTNIIIATLAVTPVIILDIYCAIRLGRGSRQPLEPIGTPV